MSGLRFCVLALSVLVLWTSPCWAQETSEEAQANEKALKYHQALQRRAVPGYLFDRFYNTWLDNSSTAELEEFLKSKAESKDTNDILLLAFYYAKMNQDVRAIEQFRVALENDPTSARVLYEKAVIEARTLDFETALKDLEAAVQSNPEPEVAIKVAQLQASLLVRNREEEKAIAVWQKLVADHPSDTQLKEDVIEQQISEGMFDEAEKLADQLIEQTTEPYQKFVRRLRKGDILQRGGKRAKAIEVYSNVLADVGRDTWLEREIISQIDQIFRREDDLVGLKDHLTKMIESDSGRMGLRVELAKSQMDLGAVEEALKSYEEIIKLTPGDRKYHEAYIDLLSRAEKNDEAVKQTESLIGQFPKDAELRVQLAQIHFANDDKDQSAAAVNDFLDVAGKTEFTFLRAARLLEKLENPTAAGEMYEKCAAEFPQSQNAKEAYAAFLYKTEKKPEAIAIWSQLAHDGDRAQLIRISRILGSRQEFQTAFDLLREKYDDFKNDSAYLGQLCNAAVAVKQFELAIPWTIDRVRMSDNPADLDNTLAQAAQVLAKAENIGNLLKQLEDDPKRNAPITCLLAEINERMNHGDKAEKLLNDALNGIEDQAAEKDNVQMIVRQKIRMYKNRNDWENATRIAEELLNLPGGRNSQAIRQLVELNVRSGKLDNALKWIAEWKQSSPGSVVPWFSEADTLDQMSRYGDAINTLRRALQKFPEDADLVVKLGQRYQAEGQYSEAERIYWRQYDMSEKLQDKLQWSQLLADIADDTGKVDSLIKTFEDRRRNNPNSVEPLLAMAQIHRVADNYEERRQALSRAHRLQPDNPQLLWEVAKLEESEGDWEKAIQTLETAAKIDRTTTSREKIAKIYIDYGDSQKGFSQLLELSGGENAAVRDVEKLATAIMSIQDWEQAREFLGPQLARFPDDFRLKFQLGVTLKQLDLIDEAVEVFSELLSVKKEIEGLNTNKYGTVGPQYVTQTEIFHDSLPPGAIEVLKISELSDYVLDSHGYYYSGMPGYRGTGYQVVLPTSVSDCRLYAACHLVQMAEDLNEDQQIALENRLRFAGFETANLLVRNLGMGYETGDVIDLLEEFPENDILLVFAVLTMFNDPVPDEALAKQAYEAFHEKYPTLAFVAAIQSVAANKENAKLLEEGISLVEEAKPNFIAAQGIFRYMAGGWFGEDIDYEFPEHQVEKMNSMILEWYPEIKNDPNVGPWIFEMVAQSLKRNASPEQFIEFINREIAAHAQNPNLVSSRYGPYYGYRRRSQIQLPTMPPDNLTSIPTNAYQLLFEDEAYMYLDDSLESGSTEWIKEYEAHIEEAEHPIFKIVLEMILAMSQQLEAESEDDDTFIAVKKSLQELLDSDARNIDANYLAACIAVHQQRWVDATNQLEKMRNLPMSSDMRQTVDGHLVAMATQSAIVDIESAEMKPVLDSAKAAALRMRRTRLDREQRTMLVAAFETLGLSEEADKLESMETQHAGGIRLSGMSGSSSNAERLFELVDTGREDAAVKLLGQNMRILIRNQLNIDAMYSSQYEVSEFKGEVVSLGLGQKMVEMFEPGDNPSAAKRESYAVALEMFGRDDEAIEQYKQVLSVNERRDSARLRLMHLEVLNNPDTFFEHLAKLQKKNLSAVSPMLRRVLSASEVPMRERFEAAKRLVELIEPGSISPIAEEVQWIEMLEEWVGKQHNVRHKNRYSSEVVNVATLRSSIQPSEDETPSAEQLKVNEEAEELTKLRDEIYGELSEKMIAIPMLSSTGFSGHLKLLEALGGTPGDELVELAITAIERDSQEAAGPRHSVPSGYYPGSSFGSVEMYQSGNEPVMVTPRTPVEFLAWHLGMSQSDSSGEIEKLAEKLKQWNRGDDAKELTTKFQLYSVADDQFVSVANAVVEEAKESNRREAQFRMRDALRTIIHVWEEREASVDISPLVLAYLASDDTDLDELRYGDENFIKLYVTVLSADGPDRVRPFIDTLRSTLLGSDEEQAELFEIIKNNNRQSRRTQEKLKKYRFYETIIDTMCNQPSCTYFALKEAARCKMEGVLDDGMRITSRDMRQKGYLTQVFEDSHFVADIDQFDPISNAESFATPTVLGQFLGELKDYLDYLPAEEIQKIIDQYGEKESLTFGEEVLVSTLKGNRSNAIYNIFGDRLEDIQGLPESRQMELARFAWHAATSLGSGSARYYAGRSTKPKTKLSRNGKDAKIFVRQMLAASVAEQVEQVLQAKRVSDIEFADRRGDWCHGLLALMDRADEERYVQVVHKIASLAEKSPDSFYSLDMSQPMSRLLTSSIIAEPDLDSLNNFFVIQTDERTKEDFELTDTLAESLAFIFESELDSITKEQESGETDNDFAASMSILAKRVDEKIGGRDTTILIPVLVDLLEREEYSSKFEQLDSWPEELESSGISSEWAETIRLAHRGLQIQKELEELSDNDQDEIERLEESNSWQTSMVSIISDANRPTWHRQAMAKWLIDQDPTLCTADLLQCIRIVIDGMKNESLRTGRPYLVMQAILECKDDPVFPEIAESFAKARQEQLRRYNASRSGRSFSDVGSEEKYLSIELHSLIDQRSVVTRMLQQSNSGMAEVRVVAKLIQYQYFPQARDLLADLWKKSNTRQIDYVYSRELHESLPAFLESLEDEGSRLAAEIYFSAIPDPEKVEEQTDQLRLDRLKKLADRYDSVEFNSKLQHQLVLAVLSEVAEADSNVAKVIEEQASMVKVSDLFAGSDRYWDRSSFTSRNTDLLQSFIAMKIKQGEFQPLIDLFQEINSLDSLKDDWEFERFVSASEEELEDALIDRIQNSDVAMATGTLDAISEISDPSLDYPFGGRAMVLAHVVADRAEPLISRFEELQSESEGESESSRLIYDDSANSILDTLKKIIDDREVDHVTRKRWIQQTWELSGKGGFSFGSGHFEEGVQQSCESCSREKYGLDQLLELELLSEDEILELGSSLAELHSVDGEIWRQLGRIHIERQQYQQAADCFKLAMEQAGEEMEMAKINRTVEYANALKQLDRVDEAKKLLESVDESQLFGDNVSIFEQLKTIMEE